MLSILKVQSEGNNLQLVRILFKEYFDELNEDLCFQSFDEELKDPLKKYGEPNGALFLAFIDDEPSGCIALQPLKQEGICEMKRLYVRPKFRKHKVGNALVQALLDEAVKIGYKKMVLDTLSRLQPAIKLYTNYGFINTSAYYENPLPSVVYMEKDLQRMI